MSSRKKPKQPKRLFSKKNQARRAPIDLHPRQLDVQPGDLEEPGDVEEFGEFDEPFLPLRSDLVGVAPLAASDEDPDDVNEYGMLKMSVVLEEFIDPFVNPDERLEEAETETRYRLAAMAWNMALLGTLDVRTELRKILGGRRWTRPWRKTEVSDEVVELVEAMIRRKHQFFELDRRLIVDLEVSTLPDGGYHLQVVSELTGRFDDLAAQEDELERFPSGLHTIHPPRARRIQARSASE